MLIVSARVQPYLLYIYSTTSKLSSATPPLYYTPPPLLHHPTPHYPPPPQVLIRGTLFSLPMQQLVTALW